jgi:gliding motility-associated-like protein
MKIRIKHFLILLGMLVVCDHAFSQVQDGRKYRVIAYKKGDLAVQSVSNEVTIVPAMTLYIPNTFTPNGDGLNDTFGVSGEAIKEFTMQIFNRWGRLIYETADPNKRWDGKQDGEMALTGTYVYRITASGPTGTRQTREGNFNLIM